MSNRSSLYTLLLIAPLAWGGLLLFTRLVAPSTALAFFVFFLILGVALTSVFAPLAYFIGLSFFSARYHATIRHAIRQGALLTLVIILNLILRALHSWSIFMAVVTLVAAVIIEILSLARK